MERRIGIEKVNGPAEDGVPVFSGYAWTVRELEYVGPNRVPVFSRIIGEGVATTEAKALADAKPASRGVA